MNLIQVMNAHFVALREKLGLPPAAGIQASGPLVEQIESAFSQIIKSPISKATPAPAVPTSATPPAKPALKFTPTVQLAVLDNHLLRAYDSLCADAACDRTGGKASLATAFFVEHRQVLQSAGESVDAAGLLQEEPSLSAVKDSVKEVPEAVRTYLALAESPHQQAVYYARNRAAVSSALFTLAGKL